MSKWKEIYARVNQTFGSKTEERSVYLCKVPTNSIFYFNDILKKLCEEHYGCEHVGKGFIWNYPDYKNSSIAEDLKIKFNSNFGKIINLREAGGFDLHLEVNKTTKYVNSKIEPKTYSIELDNYIKENLSAELERTMQASNFVHEDGTEFRRYIGKVIESMNECVVQFYHKYTNKVTEFEINYMDVMDNTRQHLEECGLQWIVGDTEKHGKRLEIGIDKDSTLEIKTDPCKISSHTGRMRDILNLVMGKTVSGDILFNSADDMFKFINTFADMYKAYKIAMATTYNGILDLFKQPEVS